MKITMSLRTAALVGNYFHHLVNGFFKILPMREKEEPSLSVYMESLQAELFGCGSLIDELDNDPLFLTLLSILQYLIDNKECAVSVVKREVFKAISVCGKLENKYDKREVGI